MLAGRMKLRTFLWIAAGAGLLALVVLLVLGGLGVLGTLFVSDSSSRAVRNEPVTTAPPPATPPPATPPASETPVAAPATDPLPSERDPDRLISERIGTDLGTSKIKDARKGGAFKVNLYQDEGHSTVNRAKIDLNRNDRWDEKWTIDGREITRQVSPDDDENYTATYLWRDGKWEET